MITNFLFLFTQVAPIQHIPSPFFELVDGQISVPRCFPSKKAHPHRSPGPPNKTPSKRVTIGPSEEVVEGSNRENLIPTFLSNSKHPPLLFSLPNDAIFGTSPPPLPIPNH